MANNYIRPLLEVYQQLEVTQSVTGAHLSACVVGANYALYRYGQEDLTPTPFSSTETLIPFVFEQDPALDYQVDLDSVSVYAEGLEAHLAQFTSKFQPDPKDVMTLRLTGGKMLASSDPAKLDTTLLGYPVQIGDIVYITPTAGAETRRRTVVDIVGAEIPAVITGGEAVVQQTTNPITVGDTAASDISPATSASYTGTKDTTYILQCTKVGTSKFAGSEFKVTDTAGVDLAAFVTVTTDNTDVSIGTKGLSLRFNMHNASSKLFVGDTFSIVCVAAQESTEDFDGIRLDAMPKSAEDTSTVMETVAIKKLYTGELPSDDSPDAAWTATDAGVTLGEQASLYIPERTTAPYAPFDDKTGSIFVGYRVRIIPQDDEDIYTIENSSDIENYFGTIAPENELAYACSRCLLGSQGRAIYAIRTQGTDAASFRTAMKKTEADSATYSFAPITDNIEAARVVVEFNAEMSLPDVKKWRRTLIGVDNPGEYMAANVGTDGKAIRATISADATGAFVLVQLSEATEFDFKSFLLQGEETTLHAGDKIQFMNTGAKYTVYRVLSSKEVLLSAGPRTAINPAQPISVWKANTPANAAEYVTSVAQSFNTRRALVVWCDGAAATSLEGTHTVANKFIAAELAGLSSAVLPQAPITHTELASITSAPRMYTQYTQGELDDIASKGVLIVTQDARNTPCYIRHQLTTEMDKGSLYFEDSCTRNIDNISYAVTDVLEKYIGRANVTVSALRRIRVELIDVLNRFTTDSTDDLIGPSLVSWEDLVVRQDETFKDRVIVTVSLYEPLPLNNIKCYLAAWAATVPL